jgi:hypothetical protein
MGIKENLKLMKTLDDAWNAGPEACYRRRSESATE